MGSSTIISVGDVFIHTSHGCRRVVLEIDSSTRKYEIRRYFPDDSHIMQTFTFKRVEDLIRCGKWVRGMPDGI